MDTRFVSSKGVYYRVVSDYRTVTVYDETNELIRNYTIGKAGILDDFEMTEIVSPEQVVKAYKNGTVWFD